MLKFLFARLSSSLPCSRSLQLGFLHNNDFHISFNSFSSVVKSPPSNPPKLKLEGNESFTVSYLMNSCGLSANVAIDVSKKIKLKDPVNPDSVLNLFRSYGFSETHISKIVETFPTVLLAKPEKTLLPKLKFFQSIGLSRPEFQFLIVSSTHSLLGTSLKKRTIPFYEALKSVVDDDKKVKKAFKRWVFSRANVADLVPNIEVLKQHGVPQSSISQMLLQFPRAFQKHAKFVEDLKFAKEIGIPPIKRTFIQALYVSSVLTKSTWESKLDIFERCGWSRDVTLSVIRKYPICMALSEENITSKMKFLLDEIGLSLKDIAKNPSFLGYSMKRRLLPRWSVFKILKMKGLITDGKSFCSIARMSEKMFLEQFVSRFQKDAPELLNIYKGHVRSLPEAQS